MAMAMEMSTQTLAEASKLLSTVLVDRIQICDVGEPVTVGRNVTRELTPLGTVDGLVQTISLENAVEGRVTQAISVKVTRGTVINPGQAVKVTSCEMEPSLVGQVFLLDNISQNGMALIRKGTAIRTTIVNQEGKEAIA